MYYFTELVYASGFVNGLYKFVLCKFVSGIWIRQEEKICIKDMALKKQKTDLREFDNISITAFRIIAILNMLLEEPLNDDEINQKLSEAVRDTRTLSKDTIYIYINTLKAVGCNITRSSKKNNYKYMLKSHPFKLNLSGDEINTLIDIKKYISSLEDWKLSFETGTLTDKILEIASPKDKQTFLSLKSKVLCREMNIENPFQELNLIEKYCKNNDDLSIVYDSPNSGEKVINLKAEKITLENDTFYLWGYNYNIDETSYLRIDKIKSIKSIILEKTKEDENVKKDKGFDVKYKLTGLSAHFFVRSSSCKILEKKKNELIIQTKVFNKFKFIQDILSYGFDCTVISPENIRMEIIQRLKLMSEANNNVYTL